MKAFKAFQSGVVEVPQQSLEATIQDPSEVENLEERLDAGVEEMIDDLRRLTHANMVVEVDRFVSALRHDLILPEDF